MASANPAHPWPITRTSAFTPRAFSSARMVRSYAPDAIVPGVAITPTAKGAESALAPTWSSVARTPASITPTTFVPSPMEAKYLRTSSRPHAVAVLQAMTMIFARGLQPEGVRSSAVR